MTEQEWLASEDPRAMLRWLNSVSESEILGGRPFPPPPSDRKLRLFACACCRQVWGKLSEKCRKGVESAERHADGTAALHERARAFNIADEDPSPTQGYLAMACLRAHASEGAEEIVAMIQEWLPLPGQAALLREIFGNPLRPVSLPVVSRGGVCAACAVGRHDHCGGQVSTSGIRCGCQVCWGAARCPWLTPQVLTLARAAYEERAGLSICSAHRQREPGCPRCAVTLRPNDGTLDPFRLALLADELEYAGCPATQRLPCPDCHASGKPGCVHRHGTHGPGYYPCKRCCDEDGEATDGMLDVDESHPIIAHLRSPGPHVRGCWALDLMLGRE